ncbi:predicted protein [Sclerotinia sclerotiorum 1980 UF-70]|uniref:Uncharacterized protein n=1 Tax=Sclerotinia sclerotiorum (strain ATCC 18683 / 1980 / Ss-1) TaxID=665079 RepID=A7ETL7_SCLS1|nr:predicted protein [Sclerotinia sclerotiorum 1980 UF-70]EDN92809.1 predicted protein [Sclerotinia sclerotiorum 1980 UF-70]
MESLKGRDLKFTRMKSPQGSMSQAIHGAQTTKTRKRQNIRNAPGHPRQAVQWTMRNSPGWRSERETPTEAL